MDTPKTKLQNQTTSYLISFQHFVHPPGVASTARYRVLIGKMWSIYILLWNGRTHLMNNTHELPWI